MHFGLPASCHQLVARILANSPEPCQVAERQAAGEVVTGLLFVDPDAGDLHSHLKTVPQAFNTLSEKDLCPGSAALQRINAGVR